MNFNGVMVLPISIGVLTAFAGFIFWISTLFNDVRYTKERLLVAETKIERLDSESKTSSDRQTRLETKLEAIITTLGEIKQSIAEANAQKA